MATIECCEFTSPIMIGDTAAVITITAGSPGFVDEIRINAEGCDCSYSDTYSDEYCDATESDTFPNASVTDIEYVISQIPPGHSLVIDAVERTVKLVEAGTNNQVGGLEVLDYHGLFEWIESTKGGCQRICIDATDSATNPDTTVTIETYDREL